MRIILILVCLISLSVLVFGQEDSLKIAEKLKDIDILIIAYEPEMYINYEENDLIVESGKNPEQLNSFFRLNLDKTLVSEFNKYCSAFSLLNGFTHDTNDDLFILYANSSYLYEKLSKKNKNYTLFKSEDSEIAEKKQDSQPGELVSVVSTNADKFLNVKYAEKDIVKNLARTYENDLFLVITQFEIKGDYSNPYAVNSKSYERRIKVHYSVYNKAAEFLQGGYSYLMFSAKENNINIIADNYFKLIAADILKNVAFQL
ncbi:MAG: hypothetical protein ABIJ97_06990 [Bacteroidota bacterium]